MASNKLSSTNDTAIIIPVRFASTRLPGKPLAKIAGKSMVERVWRNACAAACSPHSHRPDQHRPDQHSAGQHSADHYNENLVVVATDDERIQVAAKAFGATVVMTPSECANGSERVYAASRCLAPEVKYIINLQGDSPLLPPATIAELIESRRASKADIVTLAVALPATERQRIRADNKWGSGTYVACDHAQRALYFSHYPLPFVRDANGDAPLLKHIGVYAYTRASLAQYLDLPPSALEASESLEQLRALQSGMAITVHVCDLAGRTLVSVDTQEDVVRAASVIATEGELLP